MKSAVTREALRAFILRAVVEKPDSVDWQHFMVAHYLDPVMETARRECVRVIAYQANGDPDRLTPEQIQLLKAAASDLN